MPTHLYCLLPAGAEAPAAVPPGLAGLRAAPVRALVVAALELWVSDVASAASAPAPDARDVMAHLAVVDAALATGRTPLPARFGQRFASDAACVAAVRERAGELAAALARLDGLVEMTVIVAPSTTGALDALRPVAGSSSLSTTPAESPAAPGAGRRYLERLRSIEDAEARVRRTLDAGTARLRAAVAPLVRAELRTHRPTQGVAALSHLIARRDEAAYREVFASVPPDPGLQHLLNGPRAPFSFTTGSGMELAG